MISTVRRRVLPAAVCALILVATAFGAQAAEGGGIEYASDAHRAVNEMVNLSHLDYLRDEIVRSDGTVIPIWWVYCEPSISGDRSSKYKYVEAASEGISCVDDVARAALAYLAEYERSGSEHALDMARDCFTFIEVHAHARGPLLQLHPGIRRPEPQGCNERKGRQLVDDEGHVGFGPRSPGIRQG